MTETESAMGVGIVSVDDHVVEPPTLWSERLPPSMREVGPRVERLRVGDFDPQASQRADAFVDVWRYEDLAMPMLVSYASAGYPPEERTFDYVTYDDIRPGAYSMRERLDDMDVNGVDISLCFPNMFVRFCGQTFLEAADRDVASACVRAYNDWMIEEWAEPSAGRLVPNCIVPLWSAEDAASEVERVARRGCRSICFSELPERLGLPSLYSGKWDPLLRVCDDHHVVFNLHIGSGSSLPVSSADAPTAVTLANNYGCSSLALTDWLVSGVLERFPNVRVSLAEAQAGWIPYLLDRLDKLFSRGVAFDGIKELVDTLPSELFRRQVFACIFDDPTAIQHLDVLAGNLCFETDYPHADGTWPDSVAIANANLAGVSAENRERILRTNALRMLGEGA